MSLAPYHPQVVHFVIALLIVGVVFRFVSLTRRFTFTSPAATTLILLGTLASFVAVRSGEDAHGPVERVPGARQAASSTRHGANTRATPSCSCRWWSSGRSC